MRGSGSTPARLAAVCSVTLIAIGLLWVACSQTDLEPTGPVVDSQSQERGAVLSVSDPFLRPALSIQESHTPSLLAMENVVGTAIGAGAAGEPVLLVLTNEKLPAGALPDAIDGLEVVEHVTGEFRVSMGSIYRHTERQDPPIELGTSGGWGYDEANGYCCGGTLGALIESDGTKYILSNYHVLENDIVPGENMKQATPNDPVIQPGLPDDHCDENAAQTVASLRVNRALPDGNIDAAVAEIVPGMVDESGSIIGIGIPSSQTTPAYLGQKVMKSGAGTGITKSKVEGLNAAVQVKYFEECAGPLAFTKIFYGQILLKNPNRNFFDFGDSGAVMLEDNGHPKTVGLLFAGSTTLAAANPIDEVLAFFDATMVGQ